GNVQPIAQENLIDAAPDTIPNAPKIFTETCLIQWDKTTENVFNLIRGLSPYPAAFTQLHGKKLKIFTAVRNTDKIKAAGQIESDQKTYLRFYTFDGAIDIIELQLEGKKRMNVADFLRGYKWPDTSSI
ncbi:MAG: methionyl-tRNA formyltransferase, partial [Ferruginibacter sp.]